MARAVALVAVAAAVAGCGSAEPTDLLDSGDTPSAAVDPAAAGTVVANEPPPAANEIANANVKPNDLIKISAITPKKFAKAHCDSAIMVLLYQPGAVVDTTLYAQAKLAAEGRKNLVTIAYTPKDVKQFGDLPSKLGLLSTPGLAIVDRSGRMETFWTSYVDASLIGFQIDRALAATPCKITAADVPAAGSALGEAAKLVAGGKDAAAPAAAPDPLVDPMAGAAPAADPAVPAEIPAP